MDKSENLKDAEFLYKEVCKTFKQCGNNGVSIPSREHFFLLDPRD